MKIKFPKLLPFSKPRKKRGLDEVQNGESYHKISLDELERILSTSVLNGIDSVKASQLLAKFGKNRIKQKKQNPIFKIVGYFFTGFCSLLWIAAIVCILAWKPIGEPNSDPVNLGLGILLILVIFLQAAFSAFQDWSSGKVMKSIKNMMPSSATVIRNGIEHKIPVEEVVVGDLVLLSYGNKVPADVRIIETHDLKFDKSMLTGESEAIEGTLECTDERYVESKNIAFMTTLITNGQGKGIVVATGGQTMMGKIASLTSETKNQTSSLQKELKRFVFIVGTAAIIMAIIVSLVWAFWLRVKYPNYIDTPNFLVNTISVMIAFIPEGLPVCVTLSLLIIAKRMAKSRVLVKNLAVIETLSCVNVIASDKTGTLTQNKMFVASAAAGSECVDLSEYQSLKYERTKSFEQLVASSGLCNNAHFEEDDENNYLSINQKRAIGDATDIALLRFSAQYEKYPQINEKYSVLAEIPFNSRNKWMVKIVKPLDRQINESIFGLNDDTNEDVVLIKGAPDYLLKKSTSILEKNGQQTPMNHQIIDQIIKLQNEWCIFGQRVLVICKRKINYGILSQKENFDVEKFVHDTNDFCIIGLVGIIDPPREGIADVITNLKEAGIRVFMVTGDYALTAAAIAVQIGIFTVPNYDTAETMRIKHKQNKESYERSALLLTGSDIESMSDDDWRLVTPYQEIVLARTTPEQKLRTVKEFQNDKYIVGVTGDGVNDAPALKSADIGIAMGGGSEVAMEASQLVLLDNNFSSILIAIRNGRLVFKNLRKVILYLLPGGCFAELIPVLMSMFVGVAQNISSFQMLVISLFTDIAPSLSLMMEKEESDLLKQPPRSRKDHLVDWKFSLHAYLFLGMLVVFSSQCLFFIYMETYAGLYPGQIFFSFDKLPQIYNSTNSNFSTISEKFLEKRIDEHYFRGQTVTFVSIILLQLFGNLLSTRTNMNSFFKQDPWKKKTRNLYLFGAQVISLGIMIIVVYVPWFHKMFNSRPIPVQFLLLPLVFSLTIFIADEVRKFMVRRKFMFFHKIAW
ncbi:unnamed protein product [Brachionus calyciflorus]|uniref:Cation-transporting P-type ATPase N-terminal domain-containing protein n=1 Tax=Brachionus calyciflorus TaxID=104777 RepID=A0A813RLE9_9BILA|nr:unnamed protein product [Brachionus calyciflorus]